MAFFRQYIAPLFIVLIFLVSLVAVSARIFLPEGLAQPVPPQEVMPQDKSAQALPPQEVVPQDKSAQAPTSEASDTVAQLPSSLSVLVNGLPEDLAQSTQ